MKTDKKQDTSAPLTEACLTCGKECCGGCSCRGRSNLESHNWLGDLPGVAGDCDIVEVHFKNTRRGFYRNTAHLDLKAGDVVAVEAAPGHDIGQVALTGPLAKLQMKRTHLRPDTEILRVFRKAKPADIERFEQAKAREADTMIRSRKIAVDLGLKMKIGDVEYQGDGNKAIFYYIADERVDFRQLIKVLADVFKIRVEMKQIGARQEAGRIGGIGPCGRPLCCASWMANFTSVSTNAARFQDISLNPQKLAGQCAKLKCCLNFEIDTYVEASRQMPRRDQTLETKDAVYFQFKSDVLKGEITYSTDKHVPANLVTLTRERVFEVMALNKNGIKPDKLAADGNERDLEKKAFGDILGQDAITRFDRKKKKKKSGADKAKGKQQSAKGQRPADQPKRKEKNKQQQGERPHPNPNAQGNARARNRSKRQKQHSDDSRQGKNIPQQQRHQEQNS